MKGFLSAELNAGQMVQDVKLAVNGAAPVEHYGRQGGMMFSPDEVLVALKEKLINKSKNMAEVVEIKQENLVYAKPKLITENVMHYCPGCSHGTIHKLVAEVIDEMGMEGKRLLFRLSVVRFSRIIISMWIGFRRLTAVLVP